MLDLDPIKGRLAASRSSRFLDAGNQALIHHAKGDIAALVAEVERLRAAEETRVAHMWRVHEAVSTHQQALKDQARPEDLALWEATYDER
jgi:hypothetical protein